MVAMKKTIGASFLALAIVILALFLKNNQIKKPNHIPSKESQKFPSKQLEEKRVLSATPAPKVQNKSEFKTYTNNSYNLSFQYPKNLSVVPEEACGWVLKDVSKEDNCLISLKLVPSGVNMNYVPAVKFWLVRDLSSVEFGGQAKGIFYDKQINNWVENFGTFKRQLPISSRTISGKPVIKAQTNDSYMVSNFYIIPDYEKNMVGIFSVPQSWRVRCGLMETKSEKTECESYVNSIIRQFGGKGEKMTGGQGWLPEKYFKSIYSGVESTTVKSLKF